MKITIQTLEITGEDEKEAVLKKLANSLFTQNVITDADCFFEAVLKREQLGNTHIGYGAALVHLIHSTVIEEGIHLFYFSKPITRWHIDEIAPITLAITYVIHDNASPNLVHIRTFSSLCAEDDFLYRLVNRQLTAEGLQAEITQEWVND